MLPLLLLILIIVVPILELAVLIRLGTEIGILPTLALLVVMGIAGAWLARWQGTRVFWQIRDDLEARKLPADRLLDAAMIVVAGGLLLLPGLLSDVSAFVLLIPPVRHVVREFVKRWFRKRFRVTSVLSSTTSRARDDDNVVDGTVVEEHQEQDAPRRLEP